MANRLSYRDFREFFAAGAGLCDVFVHGMSPAAWAGFFDLVRARYPHELFLDGRAVGVLPPGFSFNPAGEIGDVGLSFRAGNLEIRAHWMQGDYLELDTPLRTVDRDGFESLTDLMRALGRALGRDVFLADEGSCSHEEAFTVYLAARDEFRRPRHGEGADGSLARRLAEESARVLDAVRPHLGGPPGPQPSAPIQSVRAALAACEAMFVRAGEFALQDELTSEQRARLEQIRDALRSLDAAHAEGRTDAALVDGERWLRALL